MLVGYGFVLNCVLGCRECGGCVVVIVGCWQQCGDCFFFSFLREFLLITSTPNNSFLLSDQGTNQFFIVIDCI